MPESLKSQIQRAAKIMGVSVNKFIEGLEIDSDIKHLESKLPETKEEKEQRERELGIIR